MNTCRLWLSVCVVWFVLGWGGPAQDVDNSVLEKPDAPPVLKKRALPIMRRHDVPVLKKSNAPALNKPDTAVQEEENKPDTAVQEEEGIDVQKEPVSVDQEQQPPILPKIQPLLPVTPDSSVSEPMIGLKYEDMDLDEVLKHYSEWTGLALMKAPNVPAAKITLKCPKRLPKDEALLAIEGVLSMHGIALVPMGDKFLKVVPIAEARQQGMVTSTGPLKEVVEDTDHLVSQIVELKHIDISEAQTTIQNLLHGYGKIMPLERVNCMLITDSAVNLKRILEILEYLDQPVESREELRIFHIAYAKASDIRGKIEEIIADADARDSKTRFIRQQLTSARLPTRSLRPRIPGQPAVPSPIRPSVQDVLQSASEKGLIHGKVKMVADDRTNALIIITKPEQFKFLENIIEALDRRVEPNVTIKVIRLQYATAKDVVSVLNDLISSSASTTPPPAPIAPIEKPKKEEETAKTPEEIQISGRLSSDVKIIADTRINALLIMSTKTDMKVIEDVMTKIDIMLSQVLIEVVIVEIGLSDELQSGIDWFQRSMIAYNKKQGGRRRAFLGFAGTSKEGTVGEIRDATAVTRVGDNTAAPGSGLTYYFSFFDYNLDAVINMLAESSDARLLSTPIILTTDNAEARIMVGEKRPIVTSTSITSGGTQQSAYEYTDIGIELKVTPHINKKGFVVMDIEQNIDNVGDYEIIDGNKVPVITTREFSASLSVDDGHTIVVGGLMSSDKVKASSRIPLLGDIPFLGRLFRSDYKDKTRRELLVLITPYVLDTPERVYEETQRRRAAIDEAKDLLVTGWSESSLFKDSNEDSPVKVEPAEKEKPQKEQADQTKGLKQPE